MQDFLIVDGVRRGFDELAALLASDSVYADKHAWNLLYSAWRVLDGWHV